MRMCWTWVTRAGGALWPGGESGCGGAWGRCAWPWPFGACDLHCSRWSCCCSQCYHHRSPQQLVHGAAPPRCSTAAGASHRRCRWRPRTQPMRCAWRGEQGGARCPRCRCRCFRSTRCHCCFAQMCVRPPAKAQPGPQPGPAAPPPSPPLHPLDGGNSELRPTDRKQLHPLHRRPAAAQLPCSFVAKAACWGSWHLRPSSPSLPPQQDRQRLRPQDASLGAGCALTQERVRSGTPAFCLPVVWCT